MAAIVDLLEFTFPVGDAAAQALDLGLEVGHFRFESRNALIALPTPRAGRSIVMRVEG